jgi:large subunit ribosomal protein L7/L12
MANIKKLVEEIVGLTNKETLELVKELENLGFKAPEPQQVQAVVVEQPKVEEKTSFDVVLTAISSETKQKMETIKIYKNMNQNMSLMEAKSIVEAPPVELGKNITKGEAEALKQQFEAIGAKIEVK